MTDVASTPEGRRDQIVAALRQNLSVLSDAVDKLETTPTTDVTTAADVFATIGEVASALGDAAFTVASDLSLMTSLQAALDGVSEEPEPPRHSIPTR